MCLAYRHIPEDEVSATEKAIAIVLNEWDGQGYQAYLDFSGFVARNVEGGLKSEVAVGAWLVWNIKGSDPSKEELEAGAIIGPMLFVNMEGSLGLTAAYGSARDRKRRPRRLILLIGSYMEHVTQARSCAQGPSP